MSAPMYVAGFGHVSPYAKLADFPLGPEGAPEKLDLSLLERSLRRGLSDTTRLFFHVAASALASADVTASSTHVVFASAFGEIATAEALLALAHDDDSSSPARFRHSVHNTAPGLLSISTHNLYPATAIAAGWDTVAMALLEAEAQLADGAERVLLVLADERVPEELSDEHTHPAVGAAFVLTHRPTARTRGCISGLRRTHAHGDASPFGGGNHPLGPALWLCRALEEQAHVTLVVGKVLGSAPAWCVDVSPGRTSL